MNKNNTNTNENEDIVKEVLNSTNNKRKEEVNEEEIPSFSELTESAVVDGDKVSIKDIHDIPLVVTHYSITKSKYSNKGGEFCTRIQFYKQDDENKKRYIFFTGSGVIKRQIDEIDKKFEAQGIKNKMFKATVKQINNYTAFT